jgi:WD40 repeat protein
MSIKDPNNSDLYCLDFRKDGGVVAVGGLDCTVKLYDENTKALITTLKDQASVNLGHTNRVFAVRFTEDPNLLVSAGWDNALFFWDVREARSIGFCLGPHACSNSMDIRGNVLLTGSYSNKDVLQLWSISERKLMGVIPWEPSSSSHYDYGYLYAALYDKSSGPGKYIAAGGAGENEVRFFRNNKDFDLIAKINFPKTVTSIDFANSRCAVAIACGDGHTRIYAYDDTAKM